jgi:diguanylate cyclase (GGDEF)-like protein
VLAGREPSGAVEAQADHAALLGRLRWQSREAVLVSARAQISAERRGGEHERLVRAANTDPLTGLHNRRAFDAWLGQTPSSVPRVTALVLLDLDGFKQVNDTLGHAAGDELLTRIGEALRSILRDSDVLARIGGDEFALILPDTDVAAARVVGDKLVEAVRASGSISAGGRSAGVTVSVGITPVSGGPELDVAKLLIESDLAMYHAKESGKNRVAVYAGAGVVATS